MPANRSNQSKKLSQILLATLMFGSVSSYAAGSPDENGVKTIEPVPNTFASSDTSNNEGKEGMAWREREDVAVKGEGAATSSDKKPTVLFVCGGNTGRSFAAEKIAFFKYYKYMNTFSRGSGINPDDSVTPEEPMMNLLLKDKTLRKHASKQELETAIDLHRATPANVMDINKADTVLTMTADHEQRLKDMIDRECATASIDARNLDPEAKGQWDKMCANTERLKNKIHTLIGCATGTDGDIPDGYGKSASAYPPIYKEISENIKLIVDNTLNPAVNTVQKPAHGMLGMSYHPKPSENIYCKKVKSRFPL
ncbi:MAG: hypothetical protein K0R14_1650 [Burkholderiales bacterium]|nr:hypothetical protein [Burkholderiales bacterium]